MQDPSPAQLRRSGAIRVLAAVAVAGGVTALTIVAIWGPLDVHTDIVGYPTYTDFNFYNYFNAYYLVVGFFPIAALLLFLGLTRLGPRIGLPVPGPRGSLRNTSPVPAEGPPLDGAPALADAPAIERRAVGAGRVAFVGSVLGLEAGIAADALWPGLLLGVAIYALAAFLGAEALARWGPWQWPLEARLSAINAIGAPLTVAGLFAVSSVTEVRVLADGSVDHYPWFPVWLALPLTAALLALVGWELRRVAAATGAARVERRALLLIAVPACLFLLLAGLPGETSFIDTFEAGQRLTAANLVLDGWLPWRDVIVAHGILDDVLRPAIGWAVFEHSYWGFLAGFSVLTIPLYFISFYFLSVYLFGRNWLFLLFTALIVLGTSIAPDQFRFILWPLILLMLAGLLNHPTRLRSIALAFLAVGQTILTPEAAPGLIGIAVVLPLYELYNRELGTGVVSSFPRTLWFAGAAIAFAAAFVIYMASRGALDDFVFISRAFARDHPLTGALPPTPIDTSRAVFDFFALTPPAALLISFAYAVARLRLRLRFRTEDWVMGAVAVFLLIYYLKFLSRMDSGHVLQPYTVAMPLLLYIVYRFVTVAERALRARGPDGLTTRLTAHPVTLILVLLVAVLGWDRLSDRVTNSPANYRPPVAAPPKFERVGYTQTFDGAAYRDIKRVVDAYLDPDDRLFDFTDEPGLFYFMDREPSTRYFQVNSIALREETQEDLIELLREAPPKLILFDNTGLEISGLSSFDAIPTMVRMYLVSQWILDRYRPLLETHGHTIYVRRDMPSASKVDLDLAEEPVTKGVPFLSQGCLWGYVPNFLSGPGMPGPGASSVSAQAGPPSDQTTIVGWAGDPEAKLPAREVIATVDGRIVGRAEPSLPRPDLVAYGLPEGFGSSGFQMQVRGVPPGNATQLRAFGIARDGRLTEIVPQGAQPAKGTIDVGGRSVRIDPKAVYGQINSTAQSRVQRIELPPGSQWTDYRWLALDAGPGGFRDGSFAIYDLPNRPSPFREISFKTLDRSPEPYVVPVANCAQWHGYRSRRLYLQVPPEQDIAGVRLIR